MFDRCLMYHTALKENSVSSNCVRVVDQELFPKTGISY